MFVLHVLVHVRPVDELLVAVIVAADVRPFSRVDALESKVLMRLK